MAAVCPLPVQLALTEMRQEEKAKTTASYALLVHKMLHFMLQKPWVSTIMFHSLNTFSGRFQDLSGQKECSPCPPGFHCPRPTRGSYAGVSVPLLCPAGYVCPGENPGSRPLPCPRGTYSSKQGLINIGKYQRLGEDEEHLIICLLVFPLVLRKHEVLVTVY